MARCRLRPKTKWLLFLFMICVGGIILTYRQLSENDKSRHKDLSSKFPSFNDNINVIPKLDAVYQIQMKDAPAINNHFPNSHISNYHRPRAAYQPPAALTEDQIFRLKGILKKLYPTDWSLAANADEMVIDTKILIDDLGLESQLTCKTIDNLKFGTPVRQAGKKFVDNAFLGDESDEKSAVIVKSQAYDKTLKIECMKRVYDPEKCTSMGNYKMLREVLLLMILNHPGVVSMLGFCLRGDNITPELRAKGIVVVTESARQIQPGLLNGYTWTDKLQFCIQLAELLHYLEHSPLGSLGFGNIHAEDFVIVQKEIKLVDLGDFTIGDPPCHANRDCSEYGYDGIVTECTYGHCVDYNAKRNLQKVVQLFLQLFLRNPPPQFETQINKILNDLSTIKMSAQDLVERLRNLKSEKSHYTWKPKIPEAPHAAAIGNQIHDVDNRDQQNFPVHENKNADQKQIQKPKDTFVPKPLPGKTDLNISHYYERFDQSNYPGKFDYLCPGSKVIWGCAVTAASIDEAKYICDRDYQCQSFVIFSFRPESDKLMTVILKNSAADQPSHNIGAILFMKKDAVRSSVTITSVMGAPRSPIAERKPVKIDPESKENPLQCVKRILVVTDKARSSRERRLMAHLGFKGFKEKEWQKKVSMIYLQHHQGMVDTTAPNTVGGKFIVESSKSADTSKANRAVFMVLRGPSQYHVAYYITYALDRMLGLYHVPPTVLRTLTENEFRKVKGDKQWTENLRKLQKPDGTLKGVMTVPKPPVMKGEKITLKFLPSMVTKIQKFSREEKMQLEYMFLLWLTKAAHTPMVNSGFKGHIVLFDGDAAFQFMMVNLIGYFNNCQFPNVAYKLLICHKCHTGSSPSLSVCTLGQQVIDKVKSDGFSEEEIMVGNKNFADLATVIDEAATITLVIVEHCIRKFGREAVLY